MQHIHTFCLWVLFWPLLYVVGQEVTFISLPFAGSTVTISQPIAYLEFKGVTLAEELYVANSLGDPVISTLTLATSETNGPFIYGEVITTDARGESITLTYTTVTNNFLTTLPGTLSPTASLNPGSSTTSSTPSPTSIGPVATASTTDVPIANAPKSSSLVPALAAVLGILALVAFALGWFVLRSRKRRLDDIEKQDTAKPTLLALPSPVFRNPWSMSSPHAGIVPPRPIDEGPVLSYVPVSREPLPPRQQSPSNVPSAPENSSGNGTREERRVALERRMQRIQDKMAELREIQVEADAHKRWSTATQANAKIETLMAEVEEMQAQYQSLTTSILPEAHPPTYSP